MEGRSASGFHPRWARRLAQLAASIGLWLGALFGGAGRFDWPRGWIYAAAYLTMLVVSAAVIWLTNPGLFEARARLRHRDTKGFDKVFLAVFLPLNYILPAAAGLDNARFGWWPISFVAVYPGLLLFAVAMVLLAWAMAVNPFAETTVRIQTERGHTVVSSGPYRLVRHPMYAGAILMFLGTPLILGSMLALLLAIGVALLFVGRTALEDRTLRRELLGYEAYATCTRYRLLPGVW